MEYYHNQVIQKSWEELLFLRKTLDFVLIGGWAVYLYTHSLKSKDIDIIISFDQLAILKKHYQLSKNERLKKYEAVKESVQIDIYLPHYSLLGIPAENLITNIAQLEGFKVIDPNYLFVLKLYTLSQRGRTPKGRKDFLDLISLVVNKNVNFKNIRAVLKTYKLKNLIPSLKDFLQETTQIEELNLNTHFFARIKKEVIGYLTI